MRYTNADFWNTFTPAPIYLRFDTPPNGGSLIVRDQADNQICINVPANYAFANRPTAALLDRLAELKSKYSTAWLPYSTPPNENAFQNARDFVSTLPLSRMAKPAINVASDGEVNFQWSGVGFHIDLGFYGNGKFSFYGAKEGRAPIIGDDVPVKDGIPTDLADFASTV